MDPVIKASVVAEGIWEVSKVAPDRIVPLVGPKPLKSTNTL